MPFPKILLAGDPRLAAFPDHSDEAGDANLVVGWREWVGLPELGIGRIEAKVDTGARTSALHANSIELFELDGLTRVRFDVTGESETEPWHEAPVADRRAVRSSNGGSETRVVIRTVLGIYGALWPIEITLTNRERMELPMLIGREALSGRVLVDPARSWLCGRPSPRKRRNSSASAIARARAPGGGVT